MVSIMPMKLEDSHKIREIDRSETSTETESAVKFYRSCGSTITSEIDEELFEKEPHDIHMWLTL
ncbi:hypothetical protein [Brevibacillus thermoruber]|uniref:hypothetical protein n=1 Tax=Brevibacillus thermoruber TaxID=33942 RepID=UPI00068F411C|nr:hypothetical protein [Brevibacillus thermoruber]